MAKSVDHITKSITGNIPSWIPLPDPIPEDEVKLELAWTADERILS